ncbi:RNA-binding protein [Galdieria sulphuraria]|uniref:RNA-binding protein n=1 Tax=Galdieria sulphuraria TaxID=130081 RepID=M2WZB1_GALSU|nr:RNA-binding protein [Galdieria sulphuraria]EME29410.1 RNA-binding protein [Galdieria sulphuraria]|eukprot:XP_005705930.1 RNA-binding protein [Galdieria sulphuraria]
MSQAVRLFIGNLSWKTSSEGLKRAFQNAIGVEASVVNAHVVMDRYSGRSRGFGFVTFESPEDAASAVNLLNGKELDGRAIRVDLAHEREESAPRQRRQKEADDDYL